MRIDIEAHLLVGASIGIVHDQTDLGEHIITIDLVFLRFVFMFIPDSAEEKREHKESDT